MSTLSRTRVKMGFRTINGARVSGEIYSTATVKSN